MMSHEKDIPEPESYDEKEVFSFFGLAAYHAQVFEQAVIHFAVALETQQKAKMTREIMDSLFESMGKKTIGRLLKRARSLVNVSEELDNFLIDANVKRVDLVHYFFFRHSEDFMSETGRILMIKELREMTSIFMQGNTMLESLSLSIMSQYGLTRESIEKEYQKMEERVKNKDHKHRHN